MLKELTCFTCSSKFLHRYKNKKFCSDKCQFIAHPRKTKQKTCDFCKNEFLGLTKSKFCSKECFYSNRSDHLFKIHEAQRKYPKIEGLNRCQIYRRFNAEKEKYTLTKDNIKRVVIINYLGGRCVKCGYSEDIRALHLDHIHGDGYKDRKLKGKSGKVYRHYVKNLEEAKEKLQVLCANCHAIKSIENRDHDRKIAQNFRTRKK